MQFFATDYWQQGKNASALLLQQYVCEGIPVHFSCVCRGMDGGDRAGGYMTGQLLQWFRRLNLKRLVRGTEKTMEKIEGSLQRTILRADDELADAGAADGQRTSLAGIFCVGEDFLLYCRGGQKIHLINTGFGRVHMKRLGAEGGELCVQRGILQPDIGLLLTADTFWEHVTEQMAKEGLFVGEVVTEGQMDRHLKELGEEARRRGGRDLAAIFVRTVP